MVDTVWPAIQGVIETAIGAIDAVIRGLEPLIEFVTGVFEGVQRAIEDPIQAAKDFIDGIIEDIENAFSWMDIQIPAPSLPEIDVAWHEESYGDGGWISYPEPYVSGWTGWYAKGGMVKGAQLVGVGERGAEMIWPSYEPYLSKYADAIAERMPMGGAGGVDIHDCTFVIRQESDIRAVAVELNTLVNRQLAGGRA